MKKVGRNKRKTTQYELDVIQANTLTRGAEILGVSVTTIHSICRANNITFIRQRAQYNSLLWGMKNEMKADMKAGMSIAKSAEKHNVTPSTLRSILGIKTHGLVFKFLPNHVAEWLDMECPDGMTVYEYAAIIITDAYNEENQ